MNGHPVKCLLTLYNDPNIDFEIFLGMETMRDSLLTDELVAEVDGLGVAFDGFGESALSLVEDAPGKGKKALLEWKKNKSKKRNQPQWALKWLG